MQLSKLENEAYSILRKNNLFVFTVRDLVLLMDIDRMKAYNIIKALKKKDALKTIKSGKYSFNDVDEFVIGAYAYWPSYVSFLSAISYYGYSDNTPKKILYATTRNSREFDNFKYVRFSKKRFFGYLSVGDIVIADKEKAFIDSLLFPKYSLGIKHVHECFEKAIKEIDVKKIVDYALKLNVKSVIRRLGYLLEKLGIDEKRLYRNAGKGYELLDPSMGRLNNFNKKWLLDINDI